LMNLSKAAAGRQNAVGFHSSKVEGIRSHACLRRS